jgi:uncharacterized iron-regulated protein
MDYSSSRYNYLHSMLQRGVGHGLCFFVTIILFISLPADATPVYDRVVQGMVPNSITIIGEVHQRPESTQFLQSLIDGYLQQNKCLTVALEIASSQQPIIDEIMQGRADVSTIKIPPMIDHPSFWALIDDLVRMRSNGTCLKLKAIDAEIEKSIDRDEWMAEKLAEQVGHNPVLALLGNLHNLKKVDWNLALINALPYVGEILISKGYRINSYAQIWTDRNCNSRNRFISADEPEATRLIQRKLIALLNAFEAKKAIDAVDGIILWECG